MSIGVVSPPWLYESPPSLAQRSNPCCSIFNVLLSLDRCRSCLACAGRVPHEGAPLEILLAAIPWQEVKAMDEPRRCWLRRGPQKRPRTVFEDLTSGETQGRERERGKEGEGKTAQSSTQRCCWGGMFVVFHGATADWNSAHPTRFSRFRGPIL